MSAITESAYIGQVIGTIEETSTGLSLRCNLERQLFPIRITGAAITMPLLKTIAFSELKSLIHPISWLD